MFKIEGVKILNHEEINHLSKNAIPYIQLKLFNFSLNFLNLGSIGELLTMKKVIKINNNIEYKKIEFPLNESESKIEYLKNKNFFVFLIGIVQLALVLLIFFSLFGWINYRWVKFFTLNSEFRNQDIAIDFISVLKKSRKKLPLCYFYYSRSKKLYDSYNYNTEIARKLSIQHVPFPLTSNIEEFKAFALGLKNIGAITDHEEFLKLFVENCNFKINWYYDKQSLIFLFECLITKNKIKRTLSLKKELSKYFKDGIKGEEYTNDRLNNVASTYKLSKFDLSTFKFYNGKPDNPNQHNMYQIYRLFKEIYG